MSPKMKMVVVAAALALAPLSAASAEEPACVISKQNDCGMSYLDVSAKADGTGAVLTMHAPGRNDTTIDYPTDRLGDLTAQIEKTRGEIVKIQQAKAEEERVAREKAEQAKAEQERVARERAEQAKAEQAKAEQESAEQAGGSNQTMIAALLIGLVVVVALTLPVYIRRSNAA